jgi:hypothetical protein
MAEGGHEAVPHRLHLDPSVRLQHVACDPLVFPQHLAPAIVAEARHHLCVADEVGEEDGCQTAASWGGRGLGS